MVEGEVVENGGGEVREEGKEVRWEVVVVGKK